MLALAATVAGAVVLGGVVLAVAGLLTVATFTSVRDVVRHPLSTLPTQPLDLREPKHRAPTTRRGRTRQRLAHAHLDLHASLRAAVDA